MSNQIVISSGAKVRSLEGVLTGTAGIVNSVPLGGANGVATLDSNGKVPLSQLPASVVTYLGTWNAATNTPTLANGTGDVGDLYICNVAGTVNFGAGPITFAVGDWVIYNGSEWQKSSGASGTVTSVAVTSTGNDAISITGSPITTAGTINIGFTGTSAQYVNGAGDLTTFPSLTGYVPYTGATTDVDLGVHVLNAQALHVKGTAGAGHLGLKHQSATATGSANESLIFANVDGDLAWQNDNLYLTTLSTHANTANRVYTFPNASGTIALTSDISYPVTSVFGRTGAVTAQSGDYTTTQVTEGTNLYYTDARARGAISLTTTGTSGAATYNSTTGVLNVPNYGSALSGYVPYTGATSDVDLGIYKISSRSLITTGTTNGGILLKQNSVITAEVDSQPYTSIKAFDTRYLYFDFGQIDTYKRFRFDALGLTDGTTITYTMPNASGTLALTSDIPSLANYVTLTGTQTITGVKTFSNEQLFSNGLTINGGFLTFADSGFSSTLDTTTLTASRAILLPNASGTLALTSQLTNGTVTSVGLSCATSGVTIGSSPITTSGTITLAIATASGSQQGLLSSTDWTTFNNKQNALTNPVTGTGTTNYLPKFTGASTIGDSLVYSSSTGVGIGTTSPNEQLELMGANAYTSKIRFSYGTGASGYYTNFGYNSSGNKVFLNIVDGSVSKTAMVWDYTGNVGIGTSSPNDLLEVRGGFIRLSATAGNGPQFNIYSNGQTSNHITLAQGFALATDNIGYLYNRANADFVFGTNNSERMRITSDGTVMVGTTSTTTPTDGFSMYYASQNSQLQIGHANGAASGNSYVRFLYNAGVIGSITQNGTTSVLYNITSDYRLKEDFKDYNAISLIKNIKTYDYQWKSDKSRMFGVIAHELQEILPYAVHGEKDGKDMQGVDYSKLVPILVKAIQELKAEIEELKALINK